MKLSILAFAVELMAGELILLYPAEKRRHFPLKYAFAVLLMLIFTYIVPSTEAQRTDVFLQFIKFTVLFAFSIAAMGLAFKLDLPSLFASCVAGYAVQHIAYQITSIVANTRLLTDYSSEMLTRRVALEFIVFPPVYLLIFLSLGRYAAKHECYKKIDPRINVLSFVIVYICIGLTRFANYFGGAGTVTVSLYSITCCSLALSMQTILYNMVDLRYENNIIHLLWQEDRKQYQLSKETADSINIKYHDLKHKLSALKGRLADEEISSLEETVRLYNSQIKTGNEALDVILTQSCLRCSADGILISFTGNGEYLSFMNVMDVYSLFGNAVDNSIEAVRKLSNPEKKIVHVVVDRMGTMVSVNISNFFSGSLSLEDDLPKTTKKEEEGYHGFGIKSMKLIAEKYGGYLKATVCEDRFNLGIVLMQGRSI